MIATRDDYQMLYMTLHDRVEVIRQAFYIYTKKSPTIAEIAAIVGKSEEIVLECLEYGQVPYNYYLH